MFRMLALGIAAALSLGTTLPGAAQQYPAQTVTFVVAFAAGGVADTVARTVAQKLGERTGQNVVVENRAGAGGNLGAKFVTGAHPDGYTVLVSTTAVPINHTLYKNRGYATEDLRVVGIVASTPEAVAAHPGKPGQERRRLRAQRQGQERDLWHRRRRHGVVYCG